MLTRSRNLDRFVRAVYWRLVVLRCLESAGLGVLAACGLALLLMPLLWYGGQSPLSAAMVMLAMGAIGGLAWAVLRRPRMLDAAAEADRQLDLADLLSTAWALPPAGSDFHAAVLITADARCAQLTPSAVILNRLGARAWSGIGLAGALVVSLALVTANPLDLEASAAGQTSNQKALAATRSSNPVLAWNSNSGRTSVRPFAADFPNEDENVINPTRQTTPTNTTGRSPNVTDIANPDGAGPGMANSRTTNATDPLTPGGVNTSRQGPGEAAAGTGSATEQGGTSRQSNGSAVGAAGNQRPAPPWTTAAWPTAREAATAALRSGYIPAEYHDLVREYFARQ